MTCLSNPWGAAIAAALATGVATPLLLVVLRRAGHVRKNFQGVLVAQSAGTVFFLLPLLAPRFREAFWLDPPPLSLETPAIMALAAWGFGALGLLDDLFGDRTVRGLRGHFSALFHGRVTTGLVKAVGGVVIALIASTHLLHLTLPGAGWSRGSSDFLAAWAVVMVLLGGSTIALTANSVNLLDLRPLRALKVCFVLALLLLTWATTGLLPHSPYHFASVPAALIGAMAAYAPWEARRKAMLGDAGSNFLGAWIGLMAVLVLEWPALLAWALALAALHVYSEKRSISRLIDSRPFLKAIDRWGWREGSPAGGPAAEQVPDQ